MNDGALGPEWADLLVKWKRLELDMWSSASDPVVRFCYLLIHISLYPFLF